MIVRGIGSIGIAFLGACGGSAGPIERATNAPAARYGEVEFAWIDALESSDTAVPTVQFRLYEARHAVHDRHHVRVLAADVEPRREGDGLRLTIEPHDAAELGDWSEQRVGRWFAWIDADSVVASMQIERRFNDTLIVHTSLMDAPTVDAWVGRLGSSRTAALAAEYEPSADTESWVELERGPCEQRCPVYTLRVSGDGSVVYTGLSGVSQLGERQSSISAIGVRRLFLRAAAVDWFRLPDASSDDGTRVTLCVGGKTKRVAIRPTRRHVADVIATAIDVETRAHRWSGHIDATPRPAIVRDPEYGSNDPRDFEIRMKRTSCYGTCPAYTIAIRGDGTVEYNGILYVTAKGIAKSTISKDAVEDLVDRFQQLCFWQMKDRYDMSVTDIPSTVIALRIGNRMKEVVNRWVPDVEGPILHLEIHRALDALALAIDVAVDAESWVNPP